MMTRDARSCRGVVKCRRGARVEGVSRRKKLFEGFRIAGGGVCDESSLVDGEGAGTCVRLVLVRFMI